VAERKDKEMNPDLEYDSKNTSKRQIIDDTPLLLSGLQQFNQKKQ
jgi:hypothetical protein